MEDTLCEHALETVTIRNSYLVNFFHWGGQVCLPDLSAEAVSFLLTNQWSLTHPYSNLTRPYQFKWPLLEKWLCQKMQKENISYDFIVSW
jgi:hypothetical protein